MNFKTFTLNGISVFLGLIFFTAGMAKIFYEHRFPGLIGPVWLEEKLAEFGLGLFARFIAYSQIVVGFMLLTLRYRTLGAIALLPMLLNILLVTISQVWKGTPYVLAFFLLLNLALLAAEAPKLLHLLGVRTNYATTAHSPIRYGLIWLSGLSLVLCSVPLSFQSQTAAYLLCGAGIATGLYTYWNGGRAGKQTIAPPAIPEAEAIPTPRQKV
ncbi:hypothetical protein K3G39_14125 [Pontibacter sp. HSC-14F20]|uniref:hypothetical protein n=1 Tax=Pontibacter sp. HSC-14F20 TaxID=2864136 RepID=UPI001C73CA70|nr:hypothetical protein [Pontibacter sp. HSC-14F20]MBX0334376.1 hypothetical protein [Pontibacter sp. HSC-14F20]